MSATINAEQANRLWGEFAEKCLGGAIENWAGDVGRNADNSLRLTSYLELPKTSITSEDFFLALRKCCFDKRPHINGQRDQLWKMLEGAAMTEKMADLLAQIVIVGKVAFE